jgi:thiol:disulfide interchange protein
LVIFLEAVVTLALPIFLLYRFRSQAWYWHVLAVIVALVIGMMPGTALLQTLGGSMLYGFMFVVLMLWGIGGLIPFKRLRNKHA